eukprot:TRINITY_DN14245_c0_g1_i1.p1 TRINITY_DN14245_c0_g1~~TRINITY_DN14245_c0_g1_i1.p1  ORF type:complete len:300 (+),score=44.32 TRINITY_DN14245_c0_g1_i1:58-900(+)
MGASVSREKRLFEALDLDNTGFIESEEVLEWVRSESYFSVVDARPKAAQIMSRLDRNKDGFVSFDELENYFRDWSDEDLEAITRNLLENLPQRQQQRQARINEKIRHFLLTGFFGGLDYDGNQRLSPATLLEWIYGIADQLEPDVRLAWTDHLNTLRPHYLMTIQELDNMLRQCHIQIEKIDPCRQLAARYWLFRALDRDQSGWLNVAELREWVTATSYFASLPEGRIESLLQQLDANHSGNVSYKEFHHFFREWSLDEMTQISSNSIALYHQRRAQNVN